MQVLSILVASIVMFALGMILGFVIANPEGTSKNELDTEEIMENFDLLNDEDE